MTSLTGEAVFDYSSHNGRYVIGRGKLEFETKWSKASDMEIYIYNDPPSINGVALARGCTSIAQVLNAESLGYTSQMRRDRRIAERKWLLCRRACAGDQGRYTK